MTLVPDRDLTLSTVQQGFNCSSLGELLPHESLVLHILRRQKRLVNDLRMKVVSERKLAALRLLGRKNVNKRLPSALRNAEGHPVEDQICWGSLIQEHFGKKFRREDVQKPETTRALWKMKIREAQQCGQFLKNYPSKKSRKFRGWSSPTLLRVETTCRERFSASCRGPSRPSCIVRSLDGRMLTLGSGRSSISVCFKERRQYKVVQLAADLLGSCTVQSVRNVHVEGLGQRTQTSSWSTGGVQAWHAVS